MGLGRGPLNSGVARWWQKIEAQQEEVLKSLAQFSEYIIKINS
jgi:hypothetical protein